MGHVQCFCMSPGNSLGNGHRHTDADMDLRCDSSVLIRGTCISAQAQGPLLGLLYSMGWGGGVQNVL